MSRKGECWDNAVAESFWNTVKREVLGARKRFLSISEAIEQTENWILRWVSKKWTSRINLGENYVLGGFHYETSTSTVHSRV